MMIKIFQYNIPEQEIRETRITTAQLRIMIVYYMHIVISNTNNSYLRINKQYCKTRPFNRRSAGT